MDTVRQQGRPAEILLVEDNYGDVLLTKRAFKQGKLANNITVAKDGEEAMQSLRGQGAYTETPLPDLILLDLNLPKKSGTDVLREIKSDETLKHIPVVILTSSRAEIDVVKSYDLHANSYMVKPVSLDKLADIVAAVEFYWFSLVVLPKPRAALGDG